MQYDNLLNADTRRGPTSTIERNDLLYAQMRAGNSNARDEFIVGNMPLAIWLTDNYLHKWPQYEYLQSDLLAEAFLGLVTAANRLRATAVKRPTGYISQVIQNSILNAAKRSTSRLTIETYDDSALARTPPAFLDLWDSLKAACATDADYTLLQLRAQGRPLREIGKLLSASFATVQTRLARIKKRFFATA